MSACNPGIRHSPAATTFPALETDSTDLQSAWEKAGGGATLVAEFARTAAQAVVLAKRLADAANRLVSECTNELEKAKGLIATELADMGDLASIVRKRAGIAENLTKAQQEKRQYEQSLDKIVKELASREDLVPQLRQCTAQLCSLRQNGVVEINRALAGHPGPSVEVALEPSS